ncbi:MAG: pro-sigmaK processing inhibitor BofA family protein [Bacilli bacterium]
MSVSPVLWLGFAVALLLFAIVRAARDPAAFFGGLLRNLVVGGFGLAAVDYVGKAYGVHVPLNFATAGVASVLGLPGIAALAVAQRWIL